MTCIIALKTNKEILLGYDSMFSTENGDCRLEEDEKVINNNGVLIGSCGDPRPFQCLRKEMWDIEPHTENIYTLVSGIRSCLGENGCILNSPEIGELFAAEFIVVLNNVIYEVRANFQIAKFRDSFTAIGSGSNYAIASLYETKKLKKISAKKRILRALECSEYFNRSVSRPFFIVSNKNPEKKIELK